MTMAEKAKNHKKQKLDPSPKHGSSFSFKPASEVKGLRFGGQFIVKSFTVRRSRPLELPRILSLPLQTKPLFPSTTAYLPTNFTILAHRAWHTLTLGLGTKKSKVVVFVFETESLKAAAEKVWPGEVALGEVNRRLIRGMLGCEMARFKFRKGCVTFYVYAVKRVGSLGFARGEDLRAVLQGVVDLNDFLDHTAMLAMPEQRSIVSCNQGSASHSPLAMAH